MTLAFHPLVEVGHKPVFATPVRLPELGPNYWWLLPAARRSVPVRGHHVRLVHRQGQVMGLAIQRTPIETTHVGPSNTGLAATWTACDGVVVVQDGAVVSASDPRFCTEPFFRHLLGTWGEVSVWNGHRVAWEHLTTGRAMSVLRIERCRPLPEPLFARLSRAQLEIAQHAVAGLSVREISELRACSQETVRSHLKTTYARLEVCSRVELTPLIDEWRAWTRLLSDPR